MSNNGSPETRVLLAVARKVVFPGEMGGILEALKAPGIDWQVVRDGLSYHGLAPFAHIAFKEHLSLLPSDISDSLRYTYYADLQRVARFEHDYFVIASAFEKQRVLVVPFKGMAIVEDLYAQCPVRPSSDIDILIRQEDLDAAVSIMEGLGFEKELCGQKEAYWRGQYHIAFVKDRSARRPLMVEVHWDIDYPRHGRMLLPERFERLREISVGEKKVKILSVEDTFLGIALHQRRFGKVLNIRDVCDMARLLNKYKDSFDWAYLIRESRRTKLCASVYFALHQVRLFFGGTAPEYVYTALKISGLHKALVDRFIATGTFVKAPHEMMKQRFLKAHFLLYDTFWEPVGYILNIPQEQFAKYYGLDPYDKKTELFYRFRLIYMLVCGGR